MLTLNSVSFTYKKVDFLWQNPGMRRLTLQAVLDRSRSPSLRQSYSQRSKPQHVITCSARSLERKESTGHTDPLSPSSLEVKWSEVAQSCLTLCDPMDCSLPGFSVHRIFQARVLEWVAISTTCIVFHLYALPTDESKMGKWKAERKLNNISNSLIFVYFLIKQQISQAIIKREDTVWSLF